MSQSASVAARLSPQEVQEKAAHFEKRPIPELLSWALSTFRPKIALSSSFGAEDVVLIDMLSRIDPKVRVMTLDTLRLPKETHDVIARIQDKYKMEVEVFYPNEKSVKEMVDKHGFNLFYESIDNRKMCCGVRKVEPLERALSGLDAWIAGLRRDQVATRANVGKVEIDEARPSKVKLNPLADWSSKQVWDYVRANNVPYNALHDKGYPSIGCAPCTRAIKPGEDERAGRWWWELNRNATECGLHVAEAPKAVK